MPHNEVLDVCNEKFKAYDDHLKEGVEKRLLIERHDEIISNMVADRADVRRFFSSVVLVIVIQICSFLYLWGQQTQIINTLTLDVREIQALYPRGLKNDSHP